MDIADLAIKVGEIQQDVKATKSLLLEHLKKQTQLEADIKPLKDFVSRTNRISTIIVSVGSCMASLITFKWFK